MMDHSYSFTMVKRGPIKNISRATLFGILMIAYCFLYMEPALKQYLKRSKTIAQTRANRNQPQSSPVLIVCPYPPFKTSFFKDHGLDGVGAEKYFWKLPQHWKKFENSSDKAMDIYMNMSYKLEVDWQMHFYHWDSTSFSSNAYQISKLDEGKHKYFGQDIEMRPVRTVLQGLCYRLHFTNPLLESNYLTLFISTSLTGIDKLKKMKLFVVTDETWQGIIEKTWPYNKFPFALSGKFQSGILNVHQGYIEENDWKFLQGISDYDECMDGYQNMKCVSIFDPRSPQNR